MFGGQRRTPEGITGYPLSGVPITGVKIGAAITEVNTVKTRCPVVLVRKITQGPPVAASQTISSAFRPSIFPKCAVASPGPPCVVSRPMHHKFAPGKMEVRARAETPRNKRSRNMHAGNEVVRTPSPLKSPKKFPALTSETPPKEAAESKMSMAPAWVVHNGTCGASPELELASCSGCGASSSSIGGTKLDSQLAGFGQHNMGEDDDDMDMDDCMNRDEPSGKQREDDYCARDARNKEAAHSEMLPSLTPARAWHQTGDLKYECNKGDSIGKMSAKESGSSSAPPGLEHVSCCSSGSGSAPPGLEHVSCSGSSSSSAPPGLEHISCSGSGSCCSKPFMFSQDYSLWKEDNYDVCEAIADFASKREGSLEEQRQEDIKAEIKGHLRQVACLLGNMSSRCSGKWQRHDIPSSDNASDSDEECDALAIYEPEEEPVDDSTVIMHYRNVCADLLNKVAWLRYSSGNDPLPL